MKTRLALAITSYLERYHVTKGEAAGQIGVQPATLNRFLAGYSVSPQTHVKIATWLLQQP